MSQSTPRISQATSRSIDARGSAPQTRRVRRRGPSPLTAIRWLILWGFAVFCIVPLLWLLLAPSKTDSQIQSSPLGFGSLEGFARAWGNLTAYDHGVIFLWTLNSAIYAIAPLVIAIVISLPAAYALGTMRFHGREMILMATLFAMVLPATALVLPLFMEINSVHLVNTALSVTLPAAFFPFGVYLAYVHFATSLPPELLEAARIDGCSEIGVFFRIALPLAKPVIGLLVFFSFIGSWGNFFLPYVMLTDDSKFNLPVGLVTLISSSGALRPGSVTYGNITYPEVALTGLILVLPIAVIFILFQRVLVQGILSGSAKG